ncbi:hypothetical protein OLX02_01950 [Novosphingobium sp. KCTC 2891]|nr:hypothetical protein [Novosphingobium sp. KCTC 2891]MCW1381577.1 hypothetical protein [Novosphingobium sp. KCTC 2891]
MLSGGVGADSLNGGSGADFRTMDMIRDFNRIDGDRIDLSVLDANRGVTGDQAFSFIGNAAFGTGTPGQIRVVSTPFASVYQIQINSDNDAQADYAIMVVSLSGSLQAGDFVL